MHKAVSYDPGARAWQVRLEDGALVVQLGGYGTPEEASAIGEALVALLCALQDQGGEG